MNDLRCTEGKRIPKTLHEVEYTPHREERELVLASITVLIGAHAPGVGSGGWLRLEECGVELHGVLGRRHVGIVV